MLKTNIAPTPARERRAAGRPRSEKTRKAILKVAFGLLKEHGFEDVSNQQIAREAGVSTATLYRWWRNKQEILLDAYLEAMRSFVPYGSGGRPLARLRNYTLQTAEFLKGEDGRVFLRLLFAIQDDPGLREAFYEKIFLPRRSEGYKVIGEAVAAGELPATLDPDLILNMLLGPQILAVLLGRPMPARSAEKIFELVRRATETRPQSK